ncbi:MAG: M57 family metalloprotease, partial [Planctomyces sp.]
MRLTSKVIAHELGHLLGLRHQDSFGPIGYGVNLVPGVSEFNPVYPGPAGAFETFQHMMGSPASVGTTRNDDLGDLFFGERELIKLT